MGSRLENNSNAVRKRIEKHTFDDEEGDEYEGSSFNGFSDYMRRKKIKLQNWDAERRARNSDKPAIFRGVVAQVNGYTQPSLNDLHRMIVDYGGGFLQYLDGKTACTHIIAANLTSKKREEFKAYRVVKPAWVVDSIKAGKLQPWDKYRVIDDISGQRVIGFQDGKVVSQSNVQDRQSYTEQTDGSWYARHALTKASEVDGTQLEPVSSDTTTPYRVSVVPSAHNDAEHSEPGAIQSVETTEQSDAEDGDLRPAEPELLAAPSPGAFPVESNALSALRDTGQSRRRRRHEDWRPDDLGEGPIEYGPGTKKPVTAEEHNALILADPKKWKSTVVNPAFLKQYYEESRLHHLSSWKAELKSRIQALAQEQSSSQKNRQKRPRGARRYVLHVDFDSFFVAVSMLKCPDLKEKPAVVAHGSGPGSEIASCNYPARQHGVKNGMWMKRAQDLCPDLAVLPYDFKAYEDASRKFYEVILGVGGIVQSVSIDEALVDISMICLEAGGTDDLQTRQGNQDREQQKADEIGQSIRDDIMKLTGCAVSVGIGANILQAKLALRKAKPAGQFHLRPDNVLGFIGDLKVQDLPSVAYSIGSKLEEIGIKYVKDIRESNRERLISTLGPKTGQKLWEYSQGIDRVEVGEQTVRKSVSAEVNWGIRFATQEQSEDFIRSLCEELERRLLNESVKGRQLTMKVMKRAKHAPLDPPKHMGHGECDVFNKSVPLGVATNDKAVLSREALSIIRGFGFPPGELRGIGVQVTKLEPLKGGKVLPESSQRMLDFGKTNKDAFGQTSSTKKARNVTFIDAENAFDSDSASATPNRVPVLKGNDEVDSPSAVRVGDRLGLATPQRQDQLADDSILNTAGTQFILPSQADPEIVAAMPEDIRARFARASAIAQEKKDRLGFEANLDSRSVSPMPAGNDSLDESEIDPETLAELPDDIREEIMAQYRQRGSPHPARQAVLPQSPHPGRSMKVPSKKVHQPTKRGGLSGRGRGRGAFTSVSSEATTLTQANFVFQKQEKEEIQDEADGGDMEEVPNEVLDALPEDIKAEILEQQQRDRLRKTGSIEVIKRKRQPAPSPLPEVMVQRKLEFKPRAPRPTFTARKLSSLPELREAVTAWFKSIEDEEIAHEDVDALSAYLCQVVLVEKDMAKAVSVVRWLIWLVDEGGPAKEVKWESTVGRLKQSVQSAITERGLGLVDF